MPRSEQPDQRLFRFVILGILILIFITVATLKIWELRIAAERVGVLHTIGALRSALGIKMSAVVVHEGAAGIAALDRSNPMHWWQPPPINYQGEFISSEAPSIPGVWYFDTVQRLLIYRVRFTDHFTSNNPDHPQLARYQVRLDYDDINRNHRFDPGVDTMRGLTLNPLDRYDWLKEPE